MLNVSVQEAFGQITLFLRNTHSVETQSNTMAESYITKRSIPRGEEVLVKEIRDSVYQMIQQEHPQISQEDSISLEELNHYRRLYLTRLIEQENGELAVIDQDVMDAIRENSILSENLRIEMDTPLTMGQRLADKIANFGGSWTFLMSFASFLLIWIIINTLVLWTKAFDPYPFILLNLVLSCLASVQAPLILMSQNRQSEKDRQRAEHDYKINLKAELEIKLLNEKIDHLLIHQNKKLLEIQEVQIDYLEDLLKQLKKHEA